MGEESKVGAMIGTQESAVFYPFLCTQLMDGS